MSDIQETAGSRRPRKRTRNPKHKRNYDPPSDFTETVEEDEAIVGPGDDK